MEINLKSNSGKLATIKEEYNCIIAHQRGAEMIAQGYNDAERALAKDS
jgi:hypothetical protein